MKRPSRLAVGTAVFVVLTLAFSLLGLVAAHHLWGWWGVLFLFGIRAASLYEGKLKFDQVEKLKEAELKLAACELIAKNYRRHLAQQQAQARHPDDLRARYERQTGIRQKPGQN